MASEIIKIIIAIILGIILGLALGFVLFKHTKIFNNKLTGGDVDIEDMQYVRNNVFNNNTREDFIHIVDLYPFSVTDRTVIDLYQIIFNNNVYDQNTTHDLYKRIIENNKHNSTTNVFYILMIFYVQSNQRRMNFQNNLKSICKLMIEYNSYNSLINNQLYENIFTFNIYYEKYNKDLYDFIINRNPYNNINKPLYDLMIKCNPKNVDYIFKLNTNDIDIVTQFTGNDDELKQLQDNEQQTNEYIYITPKDRNLDNLYTLISNLQSPISKIV